MGRQQPLAFALSSDPTHFALFGMQMTVLGPAFGQRQIIDEKPGIEIHVSSLPRTTRSAASTSS